MFAAKRNNLLLLNNLYLPTHLYGECIIQNKPQHYLYGMIQIKISQHWFNIRNSLWFIPSVMAISAVILAFLLLEIDANITYKNIPFEWFIYGGNREGARSVLTTIATSMVTIAGVTFSITLVALTMASAQFGPRLLRNFIADKGNQMVIGTFISTFIYSLIILLTIKGTGDDEFIPKVSVIFGFLLSIFSLGIIIYFLHHVSTSIQADYVIKSSFGEFKTLADDYFLDEEPGEADTNVAEVAEDLQRMYQYKKGIDFQENGYIQIIDYDGLLKWARKHSLVVVLNIHAGDFATIHQNFAYLYCTGELPTDIENQFMNFLVIGYQRTPNQDIQFSLKQIVEVGVRALSPGVNDPHTAITCIHWLGAALSIIAVKYWRSCIQKDDDGNIRLIKKQNSYQHLADSCFDHLRLYAKSNIFVTIEILMIIKQVVYIAKNADFKKVLRSKATVIYSEIKRFDYEETDIKAAEEIYRQVMFV